MIGRRVGFRPRLRASAVLFLLLAGASCAAAQTAAARWLEFEIDEDAARPVTSFIVGYFIPTETLPAISYEVDRSRTESPRAGAIRMPLIAGPLPAGQAFIVRVRSLAHGRPGPWSEPSATFTVQAHEALPFVAAANVGPLRSAVAELEANPALKTRFAQEFPDVDVARAASGFRSVVDLGAALFAARNLQVSFDEIKRVSAEAGNWNLRRAIEKLKPGANARAETRRARAQSREAFANTRTKR